MIYIISCKEFNSYLSPIRYPFVSPLFLLSFWSLFGLFRKGRRKGCIKGVHKLMKNADVWEQIFTLSKMNDKSYAFSERNFSFFMPTVIH